MRRGLVVLLVLVLAGCSTHREVAVATGVRAPAGMRPVTFHGLTFDVPEDWGLNRTQCGSPVADTVVLPGIQPACLELPAPRVSTLTFTWSSNRTGGVPIHLDGHPAVRYTRPNMVEFVVPDLHAVAAITSPSPAIVRKVAGTASVTARDVNGCASRRHDTAVLPTGKPAVRAGADRTLIPGHPNAVVVCRYAGGLLEQSAKVKSVARFVATFDHLPAGLSQAKPGARTPMACAEPIDAYVVQVRYPDGPPLTVWARIAWCGKLGASNGTATGQRTDPMMTALTSAVGATSGWPGVVGPA
jgi:hypothetical protein